MLQIVGMLSDVCVSGLSWACFQVCLNGSSCQWEFVSMFASVCLSICLPECVCPWVCQCVFFHVSATLCTCVCQCEFVHVSACI